MQKQFGVGEKTHSKICVSQPISKDTDFLELFSGKGLLTAEFRGEPNI